MASRKSYSREFKLQVVNFYHNFNLYQTMKNFGLHNKNILRWVKQEKELLSSRDTSRRVDGINGRKPLWPELEDKLVKEIEELRRSGSKVKKGWVMSRARELKEEMDPSHSLAFSSGWYANFIRRVDPSQPGARSNKRYFPKKQEFEKQQAWESTTLTNALNGSKLRQGKPFGRKAKKSGCNVSKVETEIDESQVQMESQESSLVKTREISQETSMETLQETSQGDWTRVEIKVEQDNKDEEGTSKGVSKDSGGSVSKDQDQEQSSSSGSESDVPDTPSDQWTAWIKEEIDSDDQMEVGTRWPRDGAKVSWKDDDTPFSTKSVKNKGNTQPVSTWLQTLDAGNMDEENRLSYSSEVFGSVEPNLKEQDDSSLGPKHQREGGQELNMIRETEDIGQQVNTSEGLYVCGSCSKTFETRSNLVAHEFMEHDDGPYSCNTCSEEFEDKGQFNAHMRQHNQYACMFCSETFTDKGELRQHVMSHPGSEHHACELCPEAFHWKKDLLTHLKERHKGQRPFACRYCPKAFQRKIGLGHHVKKAHPGPKKFACKSCNKKYRSKRKLEKHIQRRHTRDNSRPKEPECELCKQRYCVEGVFERYFRCRHIIARPYACKVCPKAFSQERYLELHMYVHTGVIACDLCSQSFPSERELEKHKTSAHPTHTPYACDVCLIEFKRKSNRDRHKRWTHPESLQTQSNPPVATQSDPSQVEKTVEN